MTEPQPPAAPSRRPAWLSGRVIVAGVIVVLAVIFIFENTARVHIRVIGPVVTARLWEALLATFLAGVLTLLLVQRRRQKSPH
jgi:uncharacterized integral membrane protein